MTIPATGLFVAPCSREAALWAVRCWHYSRTLAAGRCLYWGVWFDGVFIGVVAVSRGACANIGQPFGLSQNQIAEVTRIALASGHVAPVSQALAIVVRLLRRSNPGSRCSSATATSDKVTTAAASMARAAGPTSARRLAKPRCGFTAARLRPDDFQQVRNARFAVAARER